MTAKQLEADIVLAREFQIALLPAQRMRFPPEDGAVSSATLRFFHTYQTSGAVGGDFFDILPLTETQVGVAVCEVMGHGVRAALVTAIMRGLFEEFSALAAEPGEFITEVNRVLVRLLGGAGMTMSAASAAVDWRAISAATAGWVVSTRMGIRSVGHRLTNQSNRDMPILDMKNHEIIRWCPGAVSNAHPFKSSSH